MAYTTIDDPSAYFQTILFASKGAQTFDGNSDLQPDMIWNKNRDSAGYDHHIVDSVRGVSKLLRVNSTIAEFTSADSITSLNTDGFTIGNDANGYMQSGSDKIVTWGWKAGTSFTNDASSTGVGTIDSTGSVSTDAGFSICSFTGNGSNSQTVKHGLSTAPELIILKARGQGTYGWIVYDAINGAGKYLNLAATHGAVSDTGMWSNTAPTSSVFSLSNGGNTAITNPNTVTMIAFCFHSVKGYSRFGSYVGNGSTDGTFVYTGFKPAFVMTKLSSASGEGWEIYNNKTLGYNVDNNKLVANTSGAESTADRIDLLSNGFKARINSDGINASGGTLIYMAFAESPFVTGASAIPTTAR